jgi:hypothetical protein
VILLRETAPPHAEICALRSCRPRPCGRIALTLARCPTSSINLTPLPPRPLLPSFNSFPTLDSSTPRLLSARPRPLDPLVTPSSRPLLNPTLMRASLLQYASLASNHASDLLIPLGETRCPSTPKPQNSASC